MAVVYRYVGILTVDVVFSRSAGVFHSQYSFPSTFRPRWPPQKCLPQPGTKRRGEGILRMKNAGTSEEGDDIDSQDSNMTIDHGHLARNCSIEIRISCLRLRLVPPLIKGNIDAFHIAGQDSIPVGFLIFWPVNDRGEWRLWTNNEIH